MSTYLEDRECIFRCKSKQHGDKITSTITKRGVTDQEICAFLNHLCCSCDSVQDTMGRTALHVASSCGRVDTVKWLIQKKKVNVNTRDKESGYTALHRSIFYGKINVAVYLMKLGAVVNTFDFNSLTSLEHAMNDQHYNIPPSHIGHGEVYVWGSNTNYTFGHQQARTVPELLDMFHKQHPHDSLLQVCLSKFHCVLITTDGRAFASGHGQGGRLGLSSEQTVLNPKEIKFPGGQANSVFCLQASIARDHTVFYSKSGHVWTCGLNTHRVLGLLPPPPQTIQPRSLPIFEHEVLNVCAACYHTVAWGPKAVYTWGLNGGQLGHDKSYGKYVIAPKLTTFPNCTIIAVAASTGATAVVTSDGDIYILHEYKKRKIASRQLSVRSVSVVGGKIDFEVPDECHELKVIARTDTGNLLIWQESDPHLNRCIYSINRPLKVCQAILNARGVLFVTSDGEAFEGSIKIRKKKSPETVQIKKSSFHEFLEKDSCQMLKVTKFGNVHRAISIQSDLAGENFAVLQSNPRTSLVNIPEISSPTIDQDLNSFFQECQQTMQTHDISFKVGDQIFPAHSFIIASSSEKLKNLIDSNIGGTIELSEIHPEIFSQLLAFMYSGTCQLITCGQIPDKIKQLFLPCKDKDSPEAEIINVTNKSAFQVYKERKSVKKPPENSVGDPIRILRKAARRFDIEKLLDIVDELYCDNDCVCTKSKKIVTAVKPEFNQALFPQFHDVIIKSKSDTEIYAHKCILMARLEYFNNIFSVRWNQNSLVTKISLPFSHSVIADLLYFLYKDDLTLNLNGDIDHISNLLVISDQLFVTRLKEICEYQLSQFLTLKNVTQILTFSHIYNAAQLKKCCMAYVCLNLAALLESRSLELVNEEILNQLAEFYCDWNPIMSYRVITPYSDAPSDDIVKEISCSHPVTINEDDESEDSTITKIATQAKKRNRARKLTPGDTNKIDEKVDEIKIKPIVPDNENSSPKQSFLPARLQAIVSAQEKLNSDERTEEFVNLNRTLGSNNSPDLVPDIISSCNFPELNVNDYLHAKSPKADKSTPRQKIVKLSQKQRKRLSSESGVNARESPSPSLSESPKNPWKMNFDVSSPVGSPETGVKMDEIITQERKQKENFTKMKTKLLMHTQIEDKAIEELLRFYNADNIFDEIVTVDRINVASIGSPQWVHSNKVR